MTLFPIIVYDEDVELPQEGTYYVIAGNGFFLRKDMPLISGFVPVDKISVLPDLEVGSWVKSNIPKVPMQYIVKIKEFFRRVVDVWRSEACTVLYYNQTTNDWKVYVSPQAVSHGGVRYRRGQTNVGTPEYEGYLRVGTIHSHCDFGSFHSGTDINDEEDFDGIHGTFGNNDREEFSITASIVINGQRMEVDPLTLFDGVGCREGESDRYVLTAATEHRELWERGVDEWMSQIRSWGVSLDTICIKDRVVWVGEASFMKSEIGEGPYEVVGIEGDDLVIAISDEATGVLRVARKLLKKE